MEYICHKASLNDLSAGYASQTPAWKRGIDVVCCLVGLVPLIICVLFMTIVTQLVSPGPVFFTQERVGYRGRRFQIYKFRTMTVRADVNIHQDHIKQLMHSNAPMEKLDARRDSRLIPGGWFLRASGLDELPQIINVLRREMSLIGPRPCLPSEYELYQPWQRERFNTLPGLTGLWQVSGKNRTTFDQMIRLDIRYSRTKTWWMDLKIVLKTFPVLLEQIRDTRAGKNPAVSAGDTSAPFVMGRNPSSPQSASSSALD